ncbi:hypothetical protein ACA910_017967 [Epithemia clementina (nom. ined.)]
MLGDAASYVQDTFNGVYDNSKEKLRDAKDAVVDSTTDAAANAKETANHAYDQSKEKAQDATNVVVDMATDAAAYVKESVSNAYDAVKERLESNEWISHSQNSPYVKSRNLTKNN